MAARFPVGAAVQTPFGKGFVRSARNNGRVLVDVEGLALVIPEADISLLDARKRKANSTVPAPARPAGPLPARHETHGAAASVDLHGLTVEEALGRAEQALNEALLADVAELRLIHGRSGGRIRAALHRRLREIQSVRTFGLDPRNEGVTIVRL
jgi:DNA mismatch repair protein MutS2